MAKILKVADGAFFVPSYSEQTILPAYSTQTTIQSLAFGDQTEEPKKSDLQEDKEPLVG
jgi:hypothetical protein